MSSPSLRHLLAVLESDPEAPCLVRADTVWSRGDLLTARDAWLERLAHELPAHEPDDPRADSVLGIESEFHLESIALLLAVWTRGGVAALVPVDTPEREALGESGRVGPRVAFNEGGSWTWHPGPTDRVDGKAHPLLAELHDRGHPGFVIFTSGSTGRPKAVLHDVDRFLGKFVGGGKAFRTLGFLLFDHIAGLDTLFYTLASGGTMVFPEGHDPVNVCRVIERHRVEVLPVSPTFLNLLLLSGAAEAHDLSSVRIVTYGSEPMGRHTLDRASELLPNARFIQKYGTSEFGAPRSRSRADGSLWMQLKPDETEMKIVDGILWIRSPSAMLGYLNAPSPFDDEGWLCTGDLVERDGDWIRILGRRSDLINVGGEKVTPAEVEAVIEELDWVVEASVHGEPHPLTGSIVVAGVRVVEGGEGRSGPDPADSSDLRKAVRRHCLERLPTHKVPQKVVRAERELSTERQKKRRGPMG